MTPNPVPLTSAVASLPSRPGSDSAPGAPSSAGVVSHHFPAHWSPRVRWEPIGPAPLPGPDGERTPPTTPPATPPPARPSAQWQPLPSNQGRSGPTGPNPEDPVLPPIPHKFSLQTSSAVECSRVNPVVVNDSGRGRRGGSPPRHDEHHVNRRNRSDVAAVASWLFTPTAEGVVGRPTALRRSRAQVTTCSRAMRKRRAGNESPNCSAATVRSPPLCCTAAWIRSRS